MANQDELKVPALAGTGVVQSKKGRDLHWTGDSCSLIELVYGIFDCRKVNDGEVDLSDLMNVFEQHFQINLSRYFSRFSEIKRRSR
ncbi:RteC domain-containing protein [Pedobacter agri]|uniref:RteC domain-containing protein n=1 Tax=Pedobacter agri TaxID=454586 RepID=UPI0039776B50